MRLYEEQEQFFLKILDCKSINRSICISWLVLMSIIFCWKLISGKRLNHTFHIKVWKPQKKNTNISYTLCKHRQPFEQYHKSLQRNFAKSAKKLFSKSTVINQSKHYPTNQSSSTRILTLQVPSNSQQLKRNRKPSN